MGSLYSKMSGGRSGSGNQVAAAAAAGTTTTAIDPIIIRGKQQDDDDASPHLPDTSMNSSCISLGIEVKVNGESDDSHLVTSSSSSHAHPSTTGTGTPAEEEGDEDTDETEAEDVNNASLAVHPSTDDTLNSDPSHVSETNGHSAGGSSSNATPSKAETVATWAQVVAGMSGQLHFKRQLIHYLTSDLSPLSIQPHRQHRTYQRK